MLDKLKDLYTESIQTHISASSLLLDNIHQATQLMVNCLLSGNKIIVCGYGRSHLNAQLLVANLLNRYELARPSFPSVLLNLESAVGLAILSDNQLSDIFLRQFNTVAQTGDILVAFSPFGNESCIINTISQAVDKDLNVIVLTGSTHDHIQGLLGENDVKINVPTTKESRILENHFAIINLMCELIDYQLFSGH